ncbi:MAG: hypothetical protein QN174_06035 [Armatimonadota bacterium]|nr:hypothetical protein [Armatimonadota bacterium]MDR7421953.1 hypothetical protein [Armatimonadota bacterium]MDR7453511.1 hypothetical protein [Armatimonadota bacterium]MDR7456976.1 hypothetical protein [Armatimonadota bacterium]MDR7496499.1 hypothetical protein [Armatimonadota bacterium]
MRGFIDRVTDGVAVVLLEGGGRAYLHAAALPAGVAAGTVVECELRRLPPPAGADEAQEVAELIARLRAGEHQHG